MANQTRQRIHSAFTFMALLVIGATGCQSPSSRLPEREPLFQELTFEQAAAQATAESKAVFIFFDGDWAEESVPLLTKVFPNDRVQDLLRGRTIPLHIDVTTAPELTRRFHVQDVPLLLLVTADGQELDRWTEVENASELAQDITAALAGESTVNRLRANLKPNDIKGRFKLAQQLIASGNFDEALYEFADLYYHPKTKSYGTASKPSVIRALGGIQSTHEPSLRQLKDWRDHHTHLVLENPSRSIDAILLNTIDTVLGDEDHLLAVFRQLPDQSRARNRLLRDVFGILARRQAYEEAAALMDVDAAIEMVESHREFLLIVRGIFRIIIPFQAGSIFRSRQHTILRQRAVYFEVYAGAGKGPTARRIAEHIIDLDKTGQAPAALRGAATKALGDRAEVFLQSLDVPLLTAIPLAL